MLPYRDTRITRIALVAFFLIIIGYAYFEVRGILWGPTIAAAPGPAEVHEQLVTIRGTAAHIASLSMNGAEIPVTEQGAFAQPYLLAPGYNRIVLDARDKYGNATQRVIEIIYTPPDAAATAASSSPAALPATPSATSSPALPASSTPAAVRAQ